MFDDKISILREVFPDFTIRKGCEFVTWCPNCKPRHHKKKLEISLRDNKFGCWVCGYSGSPVKLLKQFGTSDQRRRYMKAMGFRYDEDSNDQKENLELPKEYKFLFDNLDSPRAEKAIDWFANLGVSYDVIYQNRIGFCETGDYRDRIIFPSFDEEGRLNYFVTRHLYQDGDFKWLNCRSSMKDKVFNELFIDWSKPVILVESVKGYLKHFERVENLVCGNGTKMSAKHALFVKIVLNNTPEVLVAYDATADKEAMHAMDLFYEYGLPVKFVEFEDDVQPDHISSEELVQCVMNASEYQKTDGIKNRIKNLV